MWEEVWRGGGVGREIRERWRCGEGDKGEVWRGGGVGREIRERWRCGEGDKGEVEVWGGEWRGQGGGGVEEREGENWVSKLGITHMTNACTAAHTHVRRVIYTSCKCTTCIHVHVTSQHTHKHTHTHTTCRC